MKKRYLPLPVIAALAATTAVADAHHPEVTATAGCIANARASVFVTATAWATGDPAHRVNNAIVIEHFNGSAWQVLDQGAFTLSNTSFTKAVSVPAAASPTVARLRARATVPWGPAQQFGSANEFRETTVTITRFCETPPTTTVPTTRPEIPSFTVPTVPPTTTTAPPQIVTSSTVQVRASLPEAPPAVVIVANPKFTG
jgi:hypothetical protein